MINVTVERFNDAMARAITAREETRRLFARTHDTRLRAQSARHAATLLRAIAARTRSHR
ncbi:MAG TPA: hypothetical protein VKE95_15025 [Burkholderiales bacterium]|nr:hypothetical protein [Burkholderiales bacterium]